MDSSSNRVAALGLDIGRKRIGVAGCDGTGLIATGLTTVYRRSFAEDVAEFQRLVAERQAQILVVGLPFNMDGSLGFQAKQVQNYVKRLSRALDLSVEFVDERLTSVQAMELIRAEKRSSHDKGLIDRKAAAIILQQWLDERRSRQRSSHPPESTSTP